MADNHKILQKAQTGLAELVSGDGNLEEAFASEFMRIAVTGAKVLPMFYVPTMRSPQQKFPAVGMGSTILRAGTDGQSVQEGAGQTGLDFDVINLDVKEFKGEVPITKSVFEDNIERQSFRDTILELIPKAVARDMEKVILHGDTADADPFYAQFDGIRKQITSNTRDFQNRPFADVTAADPYADLQAMLDLIPSNYMDDIDMYRFITDRKGVSNYKKVLRGRETGLGDIAVMSSQSLKFDDVPIERVWNMEAKSGGTNALLLNPKMVHVGIWRNVTMEVDYDVRKGIFYFVVTVRFDCKVALEDHAVKGINVNNT